MHEPSHLSSLKVRFSDTQLAGKEIGSNLSKVPKSHAELPPEMTSICGLHRPLLVRMPLSELPAGRELAGHATLDQVGKSLSPVITEITELPQRPGRQALKGQWNGTTNSTVSAALLCEPAPGNTAP